MTPGVPARAKPSLVYSEVREKQGEARPVPGHLPDACQGMAEGEPGSERSLPGPAPLRRSVPGARTVAPRRTIGQGRNRYPGRGREALSRACAHRRGPAASGWRAIQPGGQATGTTRQRLGGGPDDVLLRTVPDRERIGWPGRRPPELPRARREVLQEPLAFPVSDAEVRVGS